jgi:sugar transferase (PEP-CTERM/EpsH1 system associated)
MANLLYLVHRMPYPPNKGDKVRSYHILKHLAARHRVFLGTFADDPDDLQHVARLRDLCADLRVIELSPRLARWRSVSGFAANEPLSVAYYRNAGLARWVDTTLKREAIDACIVFSSAMTQYVVGTDAPRTVLVDFVDVDSAKWIQYADSRWWPLSWVYRREGSRLLAFERAAADRATRAFFVTDAEADLFRRLAPGCVGRIETIGNGVDTDQYAPSQAHPSPFAAGLLPVVFTGAMDYWPNVDGVRWFAEAVLPRVLHAVPNAHFTIVGMRPTAAVKALASADVTVTGTVPDVRPYLQHAAVVVGPRRGARGIQKKIKEGLGVARPRGADQAGAAGIDAVNGRDFLTARDEGAMADAVVSLLRDADAARMMGSAARARIAARYTWGAQLRLLEEALAPAVTSAAAAAA